MKPEQVDAVRKQREIVWRAHEALNAILNDHQGSPEVIDTKMLSERFENLWSKLLFQLKGSFKDSNLQYIEPSKLVVINNGEHYLLIFKLMQESDEKGSFHKRIEATWQYWGDETDYSNTNIKVPKFEHQESLYQPPDGFSLNYETDADLLKDMANLEWSYEAFSSQAS